jgi:hypothetical protein
VLAEEVDDASQIDLELLAHAISTVLVRDVPDIDPGGRARRCAGAVRTGCPRSAGGAPGGGPTGQTLRSFSRAANRKRAIARLARARSSTR